MMRIMIQREEEVVSRYGKIHVRIIENSFDDKE
jgi:hypothetical protein